VISNKHFKPSIQNHCTVDNWDVLPEEHKQFAHMKMMRRRGCGAAHYSRICGYDDAHGGIGSNQLYPYATGNAWFCFDRPIQFSFMSSGMPQQTHLWGRVAAGGAQNQKHLRCVCLFFSISRPHHTAFISRS
jgi:hypothetical protein